MSVTSITVLSMWVRSFSSRFLMMLRAGSTGTEMNRADTSYELRHSTGAKVMCLAYSTKSWVLFMLCGDLPTKGFRILASSLATP